MKFTSFKFKAAQFKVIELTSTIVCTDTLEEAKSIVNNRRRNGGRFATCANVVNRSGEVIYR